MSEKKLTSEVRALLKEYKMRHKPHFFYIKTSDRFTSGIPDFYVLVYGSALHLELKDKGRKADPLQAHMITKINQAGGHAICSDDFNEIKLFINKFTL